MRAQRSFSDVASAEATVSHTRCSTGNIDPQEVFGAATRCDQHPKSSQPRALGTEESPNVIGRPPRPRDPPVCPLDNGGLRGVKLLFLSREELLIIIVVPNPKPRDGVPLKNADRTIPPGDTYRPNVLVLVDALETQRGMKGILCPKSIRFPRALFEICVQQPVRRPKRRKSCRVHSSSGSSGFACPAAICSLARRAAAIS